jgi:hypothetical protein
VCAQGRERPIFRYDVSVRFWFLTGFGWVTAAAALGALARLPQKNFDLYFHDYYVSVSKTALIVALVLGLVTPLLALTFRRLRIRAL